MAAWVIWMCFAGLVGLGLLVLLGLAIMDETGPALFIALVVAAVIYETVKRRQKVRPH